MGTSYISDSDGHRINPATNEKQIDMATLLSGMFNIMDKPTDKFVTQKLTISGGVVSGWNESCKKVYVSTDGTDTYVAVRDTVDSEDDATSADFLLPAGTVELTELVVDDAGRLRFYGTNGKLVYLLIRKG